MPRRRLAALVVASVLAGLVEALALALVAYLAATIAAPAERPFSIGLGVEVDGASTSFLLGCAAALALAKLGLQVVLARQPARIAADAQAMYRRRLLDAFLHAGWAEKSLQRDGRLQELLTTQVDRAALGVLHLGMAITAGFNFAMLVLVALILSPLVAAAIGMTAVVMFFLLRPLSARSRAQTAAHVAIHTSFAEEVSEVAALAQEFETFGAANELARRQGQLIDRVSASFIPTVFLSTLVPGAYQGLALLAAVGGLAVLSGIDGADVATLGAVVLLVLRALAYSQQLQSAHQQIRQLQPYLDSLDEVERRLRSSHSGDGTLKLESVSHVLLSEVGFRYVDGGCPALIGISAAFEAGEAIGIVGSSGAGKSTLVQMLLRLRNPTEGLYEVSGKPAHSWDLESWSRRVALVPQEPRLLTSTVRENIRFLRSWITDEEVVQAARHAHIHDEILSWSNGYDTIVSNRVEAVSGGQRQRLCIARALAGSPDLLVLDEPTSVLDGRSEALIQESLSELKGKVTMVIVAHRLSTLALCDRIMVLNAGRLEAFDTAEVLDQTNSFFRDAVRLARVGVNGVLPS